MKKLLFSGFMGLWVALQAPLCAISLPLYTRPDKKHHLSIELTLTSVLEYHTWNPSVQRVAHAEQYADLQNRLNLDIIYNHLRLGGRVDTFNFFMDKACPAEFPTCQARYIPEKLYLKARLGQFDFVGGDFYLTLGRGIALSIRKVDEFGLDTTLRGARATFKSKGFRATVAAGFSNINNMDPIRETFIEDPNELIFAAEASQRIADLFRLGAHYAYLDLHDDLGFQQRSIVTYTHVLGGILRFPDLFKRIDWTFESDALLHTQGKTQNTGFAFYTSINVFLFPVTLRIEGQWYERLSLPAEIGSRYSTIPPAPMLYHNPPSMEREDLDTQGENSNAKGFRLRLDYTLPSRTTIFHINYLFRYGFVEPGNPGKQLMIHHVYAGGEHRVHPLNLKYSAGFRDISGFEIRQLMHIDIDTSYAFLHQHSLEFVGRYWWDHRSEGIPGIPDLYYHILDLQLGYAFAKWLSVSVLFSYSNEFPPPNYRQVYIAGEAKLKLWSYGYLKLFGGSARGGLRCISGVCRIFPPFEGVRGSLSFQL